MQRGAADRIEGQDVKRVSWPRPRTDLHADEYASRCDEAGVMTQTTPRACVQDPRGQCQVEIRFESFESRLSPQTRLRESAEKNT